MYKNIPFVHNSHSAKAKQLEQEGNSGTTDKRNNLCEKQSCLIALKKYCHYSDGFTSFKKKKKKLETTLSFGGIFTPQKNKFKGKKQKQKEPAHQDFHAGMNIDSVHPALYASFRFRMKHLPCLQIKVGSHYFPFAKQNKLGM